MRTRFSVLIAFALCSIAWGQTQNSSASSPQSGQSMPGHDMSNMKGMPMGGDKEADADAAPAMHSMEGHMSMGPHMKKTELRKPKPRSEEHTSELQSPV